MRQKERWLFLFLVGVLVLNWPFLAVFRSNLPLYLSVVWLLLIAAICYFSIKSASGQDGG